MCARYQQQTYRNKACQPETDLEIKSHLKEGCGTKSISRLLKISVNTITSRILLISKSITIPTVAVQRMIDFYTN